jgi:hypothetical protein
VLTQTAPITIDNSVAALNVPTVIVSTASLQCHDGV